VFLEYLRKEEASETGGVWFVCPYGAVRKEWIPEIREQFEQQKEWILKRIKENRERYADDAVPSSQRVANTDDVPPIDVTLEKLALGSAGDASDDVERKFAGIALRAVDRGDMSDRRTVWLDHDATCSRDRSPSRRVVQSLFMSLVGGGILMWLNISVAHIISMIAVRTSQMSLILDEDGTD